MITVYKFSGLKSCFLAITSATNYCYNIQEKSNISFSSRSKALISSFSAIKSFYLNQINIFRLQKDYLSNPIAPFYNERVIRRILQTYVYDSTVISIDNAGVGRYFTVYGHPRTWENRTKVPRLDLHGKRLLKHIVLIVVLS